MPPERSARARRKERAGRGRGAKRGGHDPEGGERLDLYQTEKNDRHRYYIIYLFFLFMKRLSYAPADKKARWGHSPERTPISRTPKGRQTWQEGDEGTCLPCLAGVLLDAPCVQIYLPPLVGCGAVAPRSLAVCGAVAPRTRTYCEGDSCGEWGSSPTKSGGVWGGNPTNPNVL